MRASASPCVRPARAGFEIGIRTANDLGIARPDMTRNIMHCNGQAVAKISDDPAKTLCTDPGYLAYLRKVFGASDYSHVSATVRRQRAVGGPEGPTGVAET